jgi:uncharacterized protein YuzE
MARLFINPQSDSIYIDVTTGDRDPVSTSEPAEGVYLHMDETGTVIAVEVMDMSRRGEPGPADPEMGHVHVNSVTDSIYFDVSSGTRASANMAAVAEGLYIHADDRGSLAGIEVMGLSRRGGLHVEDLDAVPGAPRPAVFDEIERAAQVEGGAASEG